MANGRKPYTDAECRLMLFYAPTHVDAKLLAGALERSPKAIEMEWKLIGMKFGGSPNERTSRLRQIARQVGWVLPIGPEV